MLGNMLCLVCGTMLSDSDASEVDSEGFSDFDICCEILCALFKLDVTDYKDCLSSAVYCQRCVDYLAETAIIVSERDQECFKDVLEKRKMQLQKSLIQSWVQLQSEDVYSNNYCPWQSVRLRMLLESGSVIEVVDCTNSYRDGKTPILNERSLLDQLGSCQDIQSQKESNSSSDTSGFAPWNFGDVNETNGSDGEDTGVIEKVQYYLVDENRNNYEDDEPMCLVLHNKNQESPFHSNSQPGWQLNSQLTSVAYSSAQLHYVPPSLQVDPEHYHNTQQDSPWEFCELDPNHFHSNSNQLPLLNNNNHLAVDEQADLQLQQNCNITFAIPGSRTEALDQNATELQPIGDASGISTAMFDNQIQPENTISSEKVQKQDTSLKRLGSVKSNGADVWAPHSSITTKESLPLLGSSTSISSSVTGRRSKRKPLKPTKGIYSLAPLRCRDDVFSNSNVPLIEHSTQNLTEPLQGAPLNDIGRENITNESDPIFSKQSFPVTTELQSESSPCNGCHELIQYTTLSDARRSRSKSLSPSLSKKGVSDENKNVAAYMDNVGAHFAVRITRSKTRSPSKSKTSGEKLDIPSTPSKRRSPVSENDFQIKSEVDAISNLDSPPVSPNNFHTSTGHSSFSSSSSIADVESKSGDLRNTGRLRRRRIVLTDKFASYSSEMSKRRTVKRKPDSELELSDDKSEEKSSDENSSYSDSQNSDSSYYLPPQSSRSRRNLKETFESMEIESEDEKTPVSKNRDSRKVFQKRSSRSIVGRRAKLKFVCPQKSCARRFSSEERRDNHFKRMHQGIRNLFSCTKCGKSFPAKNRLLAHMNKHELQGKTFPCDQCDKTFPTEKKLDFHLHQHSQNWGLYCDVCGKGFLAGQNARLENHKKIHDESRPRPFKCRDCDRTFSTLQYLKIHRKKHPLQPDEDGLYRCHVETCYLSFKAVTSFREHLRIHTGELPFECEVCGKKFGYITGYKKHMISHTDEKEYTCHICGQQFKQKGNLNLHIGRHNGVKPYECKFPGCKYSFYDQYKLKNHMDVHTGRRIYKCGECDKCFRTTTALKAHHAAIHAKERKFKCHCGKTFSQKQYLQFHKTTHPELNLKKFQCEICSKKFTEPSSLREHKRRFHTGETAFSCDKCDYTACFKSRMDKHMLTHSNPQFSCDICGKQFRQANNLKRHVKSLHKDSEADAKR